MEKIIPSRTRDRTTYARPANSEFNRGPSTLASPTMATQMADTVRGYGDGSRGTIQGLQLLPYRADQRVDQGDQAQSQHERPLEPPDAPHDSQR
jgi:hypothetical protein